MTCCKPLFAVVIATGFLCSCRLVQRPVTEQEALDFAKKIHASVVQKDNTVLDNVIDDRLFAAHVLRKADQQFNLVLAEKARAAIKELFMGGTILAAVKEGGDYVLVRHYEKDGHQHLLFRLYSDGGDFNYHDYELARGQQGVFADDAYIYTSGKSLSDAVMDKLLAGTRLADMSEVDRTNAEVKRSAEQFLVGGNPEEANTYYLQATDKARKQQDFQRLHISIAKKLGDSALGQALEEYKTNFPQDPYIYLSLFKFDGEQKNFPAALDAIDNLDRLIPGDPFLDYYRGLLYKIMGQPVQSRIALKRMHSFDPLFGGAVIQLMDNYVRAGSPDSAALLVREAQKLNNITPDQLANIEKIYPPITPYLK